MGATVSQLAIILQEAIILLLPCFRRSSKQRRIHWRARSELNNDYRGQRVHVPFWRVPWENDWPDYDPVDFTHPVVKKQPVWADPADPRVIDFSTRASFEGPIKVVNGRPLNPLGRTGTKGRGLLGKWGPNNAADPIVLRRKPGGPWDARGVPGNVVMQMVAIQRKDSGQWAIPGGMVDAGEHVSQTLRREFTEEAATLPSPAEQRQVEQALDEVFKNGHLVYEGYVDDPRNTDNAWMETSVHVFLIDDALGEKLVLRGGSDAALARWLDVDGDLLSGRSENLYADHIDFVYRALKASSTQVQVHALGRARGGH